jgi:alpha-N-acetylglucosamine transferase
MTLSALFAKRRVVVSAAAFIAICLLLFSSSHYYYYNTKSVSQPTKEHTSSTGPLFSGDGISFGHTPDGFDSHKKPDDHPKPSGDDAVLEHTPDNVDGHKGSNAPGNQEGADHYTVHPEHGNPNANGKHADGSEKLAYVTFFSGTLDQDEDLENDKYFVAIRILCWQLLHNLSTRTKNIDVVVMVTPSVSQSRRERLAKDGAIVYPVEFLRAESRWVKADKERWADVMTKLRVWEMTQYSRILVMDGDSMLLRPLDGVFDDPAAQIKPTQHLDNYTAIEGESPLPETYLLASLSEVWDSTHQFPPTDGTGLKKYGYLNAGFFMLAPSIAAFEHYRSFLEIPNSFDPKYPEQNLMNMVHKWGGPMPWQELSYTWNIRCPSDIDVEKGVVSVHEKWWEQPFIYGNDKTKDWLRSRPWEMKGWYTAYDQFRPAA